MSKTSRPAGDAAAEVPSRAPGRSRLPRDIKVMLVAAFLIAIGFGLVAPVLPQFATTFDVGATAAAVIVSIFAFMRLVFAPAGGVFAPELIQTYLATKRTADVDAVRLRPHPHEFVMYFGV